MDIDVLAIAAVAITVVLFVLLSYLGRKSIYVPVQYVFLIVLTLIVSIGTVGVPGTSTVTTTALFTAAGLPVEIIVLLVPISSVVDMMRTAANVTGAATAAVLVAKSEQLLDREVYDQKKSEDGLSGAAAVGESAR
ncbi:MAG: cation:dicarboxylate symporter family transporter [Mediterraneibacter gnavus]